VVEGARLESVYRGNSIEGSNPSLSATPTGLCPKCSTPMLLIVQLSSTVIALGTWARAAPLDTS
jgi:hypothetical protein